MQGNLSIDHYFKGEFVTNYLTLKQKLRQIKALVFDWDGVFNNGQKNIEGHSGFSEVDSMGVNMLRFSHYLLNKQAPLTAIITGENNQLAFSFAQREHFNAVYYKMANKETALLHFCKQHGFSPAEVLFVFDDVLDLSAARLAAIKCMVGRTANPLLLQYAKDNRAADYITRFDGSNYAVREVCELMMALGNNYYSVMDHRTRFSDVYQAYLSERNNAKTVHYTADKNEIVQA
jgi:3-deoxy-D-manno-octulosonate 8-phosphate phosphatase (KDO 8-P phosphatase)